MEWKDVIRFWFEECTPQQWFKKNDEFDTMIREKFLDTYNRVATGETADWRSEPQGRLAEVIVLDQFARNMFRGSPKAFANDALALTLAEAAVKSGDDRKLTRRQRQFLYMPYMHSESKQVHEKAVELFTSLSNPFTRLFGASGSISYELQHKAIIDRFGRYPHRNGTLGRPSTFEEVEFIKTHPGF